MKVLVIPDVHLKPWIFDEAEKLTRKYGIEMSVFLGDLVDDWGKERYFDLYKETIDRAVAFKKTNNSKFCYGNHEVAYITENACSGNSEYFRSSIAYLLNKYEREVEPKIAVKIGSVVFSHAGFEQKFKACYNENIICDFKMLNYVYCDEESPLWLRPDPWVKYNKRYVQVVGHTPVKEINYDKGVWFVDVFSTYKNGAPYGDQTFMSIDTETKKVARYKDGQILN